MKNDSLANTAPRVSIGLPVFQGENFIDEAIRSIRAQTYQAFELVISDNGSTDATEAICRRHESEDPRIRYHRSPVNRGSSWNYSRVVELTSAPYFKWAAHDDALEPTYLEACVKALESDSGVVVAHSFVTVIDDTGAEIGQLESRNNATSDDPVLRFRDMLFREPRCLPVFGVIRRETLTKTGLLGPYSGHDRPFLAELALHGRFAHVPEHLFLDREHSERSIRKYRNAREKIEWFDPALQGRTVHRNARLILEYHRAIRRAGPLMTRTSLGAEIVLFAWTLRHSRGLISDLGHSLRMNRPGMVGGF